MMHAIDAGMTVMRGWQRWGIALVAVLLALPVGAQTRVTVTGIDPPSGSLRGNENLVLRVHYVSTQPVRIQAHGMRGGQPLPGFSNTAPTWPAGDGDALAWISYPGDADIDAVQVEVLDAAWQPVTTVTVPVAMDWSAGAPLRPAADWVAPLIAAADAQAAANAAAAPEPDSDFLGHVIVIAPSLYLVLQILLPLVWRGGWRKAALVPLIVMLPALVVSLFALAADSNLWPIWMVLLAPLTLLYLLVLLAWRGWCARRVTA